MLKPHEQRVVDELAELEERIKKLQTFMRVNGSAFHGLAKIDRDLLIKQLDIQFKLADVLETRIKRFKYPDVDIEALEAKWHSQTLKDLMSFSKGDTLVFVGEDDIHIPRYTEVKVVRDSHVNPSTKDVWVVVEFTGTKYGYPATCFVKASYG